MITPGSDANTPEELEPGHPKGIVRRLCFGTAGWDRALFAETHRAHREEVESYFADRPGDLLVVDVTRDDPWPALCTFLDVPVPGERFPHRNVRVPERSVAG